LTFGGFVGRDKLYLVKKKQSDTTKQFSGTDIIKMLKFLIDNIFVKFGGRVFQQTVGIPMGNKLCSSSRRFVPLFVRGRILKKNEKKLARSLNFTFHYIDNLACISLSLK
jgi:hypothetical protein